MKCNASVIYQIHGEEEERAAECDIEAGHFPPHESKIAGEIVTWTDPLG